MAIDITGSTTAQAGNAYEGSPVQATRAGTGGTAQNSAETESGSLDTVNLTGTAALMQKLDAAIAATPVVDMARVNRIQQAIELIADGGQLQARQHPHQRIRISGRRFQKAPPVTASYSCNGRSSSGGASGTAGACGRGRGSLPTMPIRCSR